MGLYSGAFIYVFIPCSQPFHTNCQQTIGKEIKTVKWQEKINTFLKQQKPNLLNEVSTWYLVQKIQMPLYQNYLSTIGNDNVYYSEWTHHAHKIIKNDN